MKTAKRVTQKPRGRPPSQGIQVGERWSPEAMQHIDEWRWQESDRPNRPEAIRRLVEIGLKAKK